MATTFKQAFASAKKAGKETFVFDGKLYTTEVAVKDADESKFKDLTNTVKDTAAPVSKLKKNVWPLQSELRNKFGNPSYVVPAFKKNITTVTLPYTMWMDDIKFTKIAMNSMCADSFVRVMTYVWDHYERDYDKIKAAGLHIYSGCWNIRPMRGGNAISTHAYAVAIDIAAPYNALGKKPGYNKLSFTEDHPLVKAFETEGWTWGGRWEKRPDGMHFQAARVG